MSANFDDIKSAWATVQKLAYKMSRARIAGGSFGAVMINETPSDELTNLPFVLAYAVLHDALAALDTKGVWASLKLAKKMKASRAHLPWINFDLVDEGRDKRNDLAHESKLLSRADCLRYIEAVGVELKAWGCI